MQAVCERQTLDSKKTEKSLKKLLTNLRSFGTIKLHPQKRAGQTEPWKLNNDEISKRNPVVSMRVWKYLMEVQETVILLDNKRVEINAKRFELKEVKS